MKNKKIIAVILGLIGIVFIASFFLFNNTETDEGARIIKVLSYEGDVEIIRNEDTSLTPYENMYLQSGDSIIVNEDSTLDLLLDSDKYVHVAPNSELSIEASGDESDSTTVINLTKGEITNNIVNELSGESEYQVVTPNSTMSVRGTVFVVKVVGDSLEDKVTTISVLQGTVGSQLFLEESSTISEEIAIPEGYGATSYLEDDEIDNVYLIVKNDEIYEIDITQLSIETLTYLLEVAKTEDLCVAIEDIQEAINDKESYVLNVYYATDDLDIQTLVAGETITLEQPTKDLYTFTGWYLDSDYTTLFNLSTMPEENITVYAKWSRDSATLTKVDAFNGNSSSVLDTQTVLSLDVKNVEGYTFEGWYTDTEYTRAFTSKIMLNTDTTIYAKWVLNTYTVAFSNNSGTGTMNNLNISYLEETTLTENTFTKTGYTFKGWSTSTSGKVVYTDEALIYNMTSTNNETITLYALWTANDITLTFANTDLDALTSEADSTITLEDPTKEGYTFSGWYTDNECTNAFTSTTMPTTNTTLYALWTANDITLTFANTDLDALTSKADSTITLEDPTKEGYTFSGWYTDSECTNAFTSTTMPTTNTTLYAKWKANTYTVTFDANAEDVEGSMANLTFTYDVAKNLTMNAYTKEGYTFLGWSTNKNASEATHADGVSVSNLTSSVDGEVTLYAVWSINTYTLSYFYTEQTTQADVMTKYNKEISLENIKDIDYTGYTFTGWYFDKECTNPVSTGYTMPASNLSVYAGWEANTYSIKFNNNDADSASPSMNNMTLVYDTEYTLTKNAFTKEGYTFKGWSTVQNSTVVYADEASVKNILSVDNSTIILYAVWEANDITLTFVDSYFESNTLTQKADTELVVATPSREGYTFAGWYTSSDYSDGTWFDVSSGATMPTKNTTIYAKWNINSFTLTYTYILESGKTTKTVTNEYATKIDQSNVKEIEITGYTFSGWYSNYDCTTKLDAEYTMPNNNVEIYTKFTANEYTVIFDGNGADATSPSMSSQDFTYDTSQLLTTNVFEKTGYTFTGWSTDSNATTATYTDGASVSNLTSEADGDVTLYALWTPNTYTVTFNGNGADNTSVGMLSQSYTYDTSQALTTNMFTREGYKFLGWSTTSNGSVEYTDAQSVSNLTSDVNGTVTLYAVWEAQDITISLSGLDDNDLSSSNSVIGKADAEIADGTIPTPTKTGYTFEGWYTTSTFDEGTEFIETTMPTKDTTLYAKWEEITYTIVFNGNGGTDSDNTYDNITGVTYLKEVTIPMTGYTRTGYTFLGFSTSQSATTATYTSDNVTASKLTSTDEGTVTLYAVWKINTYSFTMYYLFDTAGVLMESVAYTMEYNSLLQYNSTSIYNLTTTGYYLEGWYTTSTFDGDTKYTGTTMPDDDLTLYAKWVQDTPRLTIVVDETLTYTVWLTKGQTEYTYAEIKSAYEELLWEEEVKAIDNIKIYDNANMSGSQISLITFDENNVNQTVYVKRILDDDCGLIYYMDGTTIYDVVLVDDDDDKNISKHELVLKAGYTYYEYYTDASLTTEYVPNTIDYTDLFYIYIKWTNPDND